MENIPRADELIIAGDLNGHVGVEDGGYEDVMGEHGIGTRNQEGEDEMWSYKTQCSKRTEKKK